VRRRGCWQLAESESKGGWDGMGWMMDDRRRRTELGDCQGNRSGRLAEARGYEGLLEGREGQRRKFGLG
jgi:hypothetical protein